MKKWISNLLKLQETDLRIRKLTTRQEMVPIEIQKIEREIEVEKVKLRKKKDGGLSTDLETKKVESEIMAQKDEIDRLQKQSVMVKKNDEYRALIKEIDNANKKISDLETRELELMDMKDDFKKTWKGEEKVAKDQENTLAEEKEDLEELEGRLKIEIEKVKSGRIELCGEIDEDLLDLYNRLLNKGVGQPLAEVVDDLNCGNCHLRLTPQTINSARKSHEVQCENCSHLLYFSE